MRISNTSPFNTRNQLEPIEKDAAVNANVANANAFNANNDSPGLTTSRNNFDQRNSQRTDNSESSISLEQSQKSPSVYENINDTGASQQVNGSSPVDSIIGSRKFEGSVVKYRFMPADMSVPKPFDEEVDPDETLTTQQWSADQKALARQAMDSISDVANIRFVEAKDNEEPDWQLAAGQSKSGRSWMNFPGNGQQIASLHWPENASGTDHLMPGGRAYFTILHEFGHGLGLEHPFDGVVMEGLRQGQAYGAGEALLNNNMHTIMSYNHAQAPLNLSAEELFDRANPSTLMPLDIAALQQKYGANTSHAQEDNVYELVDENKPGTAFSTIWDTGGDDTIKYSGTGNATLDLRAATLQYEEGGGGFSSRASLFAREGSSPIQGGLTIANGVVIENATGGSGNDRLIGNDADNTFTGNAGRDFIQGQALSFDTVDYSTELGDIGIHADLTLNNTSTIRDTFGDIDTVTRIDAVTGSSKDDVILGDGRSTYTGMAGNDLINGRSHSFEEFDKVLDTVDYSKETGEGSLTVDLEKQSATDTYGDKDTLVSIENVIGHNGNDYIAGTDFRNTLDGGRGNDILFGREGDDILLGMDGNDTLAGGSGDDDIQGGNGNDILGGGSGDDDIRGGDGIDTIDYFTEGGNRGIDVSLFDKTATDTHGDTDSIEGVEKILGTDQNDQIKGDENDNSFWGGYGDDVLSGLEGSDDLHGGKGNNTLTGGVGSDTFHIQSSGTDTITDFVPGTDKINLSEYAINGQSFYDDLTFTDNNNGVEFAVQDKTVILEGLQAGQLSRTDFEFEQT